MATLNEIKRAVTNSGGIITSETETYLSATYMSKIFKFVDDVEFRQSEIRLGRFVLPQGLDILIEVLTAKE